MNLLFNYYYILTLSKTILVVFAVGFAIVLALYVTRMMLPLAKKLKWPIMMTKLLLLSFVIGLIFAIFKILF